MKLLKSLFLPTLLCCISLLTGCIENKGNSIQVTTTGSVLKTSTGETYLELDLVNLLATSAELQKEDLEAGDRVLTTTFINLDSEEAPLIKGVYNAQILSLNEFDCESYIASPQESAFNSDVLPGLFSINPFLIHRKRDNLITFAYNKHDDGELELVQPRPFNPNQGLATDTLYLQYRQGNVTPDKELESDYISFKLPNYPVNTYINVVVRFNANSHNFTSVMKDETSSYFTFSYYLQDKL